MYSGLTLTRFSGCFLGTHQKVDRLALRRLINLGVDRADFPTIREILHFEGKNGPDALKRKSPAINEPWHYFDPLDLGHQPLLDLIDHHYESLSHELKANNRERAAFEAAWLAHALTDGLTPAHHYPYEEKLSELRGGLSLDSRNSIKAKWIVPGETKRGVMANNGKVWGAEGLRKYFRSVASEIAELRMYERYYEKGWTPKLASQVRHILAPAIVNTVAVAWYGACREVSIGS